jgi:hypothetical protein
MFTCDPELRLRSWAGGSGPARDSDGPDGQLAIGVALLGLGLVALFGVFAAAEVRRRRALARPGN